MSELRFHALGCPALSGGECQCMSGAPKTHQDVEQLGLIWNAVSTAIEENLRDPDLANQSAEFRAGYARGFREATLGFIASHLPKASG